MIGKGDSCTRCNDIEWTSFGFEMESDDDFNNEDDCNL